MKIAIITPKTPKIIEISDFHIIEISDFLSKSGFQAFLITYKGEMTKSLYENFKLIQVGIFYRIYCLLNKFIRKNTLSAQIDYIFSYVKPIYNISPNLLISIGAGQLYLTSLCSIFLSKLLKIPLIQIWMGSDLLISNSLISKFIKKFILTNTSVNFVQSKDMKFRARNLSKSCRCFILPDKGVDIKSFRPFGNQKENEDDLIRILFVGRLHPLKGITYLIEAFEYCLNKRDDILLEIVGGGYEKRNIINLIQQKKLTKKVILRGQVKHKEIVKYYQNADIFVLPSLSEGLPNVLMEAMACGLPIIATDVGGNSELITHGYNGYLVPQRNIKEISNSLLRLIDNQNLRKKMGSRNLDVAMKYNTKLIMEKKIKIIKKLCSYFRY